jgi:hypothetical protein
MVQVRILVKVIPQSMNLVSAGPEGGGNNRISEEQIKCASCTSSSDVVPSALPTAVYSMQTMHVNLHDMGVVAGAGRIWPTHWVMRPTRSGACLRAGATTLQVRSDAGSPLKLWCASCLRHRYSPRQHSVSSAVTRNERYENWHLHADLLSWATGLPITKADAMRCARREPGRSWQAIPSELTRLGVNPLCAVDLQPMGQAASAPAPQLLRGFGL